MVVRAFVVVLGFGLASMLATPAIAAPARGYDGPGDAAADPDVADADWVPAEDPDAPPPKPELEPEPEPQPELVLPPEPDAAPKYEDYVPGAELDAASAIGSTPPPSGRGPRRRMPKTWMPPHRLMYRNFLAGRIGPLGAVNEFTLGYRGQLVKRDTPLFLDSYVFVGAHAFVTPAFVRVGPVIEVQPAAVLNLGVTYDFVGTFGNFGQVQSYPSAADRSGPDDFQRNKNAGLNYRTRGHLVTLSGLLQGRVKNIVLRSQTRAIWTSMRLRAGDRVYYDQALDIPLPNNGWGIINETDLIYMFPKLRLVVRHSVTQAFYQREHFAPGEPVSKPNGPTSRLGPAVSYTFFDRPGARFNRPSLFLLSQWWLLHRWRTGEQRHPAIPYAAIGFAFEGDLVPHRPSPQRRRRIR
jgi:hypothetical protein